MTTPMLCLLGFAAHTLLILIIGIVIPRVAKVLTGRAKANAFPGDQQHGSKLDRRILRAHMNCVEGLPIFATVVLVAAVAGVDSGTMDVLAMVFLGGRAGQSLTHIVSTSPMAVNVRFTFFIAQLVSVIWMGVIVAMGAL